MKYSKPIQVFEHQQLQIDPQGFTQSHWEALGWYNEKHGGGFFSLTPKGVKFNQFVGVIQVGNITIEILPKIGQVAEKGEKSKWQKILIDMLRECMWMQVHSHEKASLRFKPNSILEAYLELFLVQCQALIHQGLVRKYRSVASNCPALKGKLLFAKQLQYNLIHKERFFTKHQVFDRENIFNQIVLKTLKLIPSFTQSPYLKDKVYQLMLSFPELNDIPVDHETFKKLNYDRRTSRYQEAMEIAAMLLLNYRPDISTGHNHVLAILFDMNDLWEEFIFRQLQKSKPKDWQMRSQNSKKFWEGGNGYKTVRPDIFIHNEANNTKVILDTKWKIPENNIPADADLKQMFVYNEYWAGKNAILLYPHKTEDQVQYLKGSFVKKAMATETHHCGLMKISVLDRMGGLDKSIGRRLNDFLQDEILK